eukprot:m51a1_g11741 hypothetical protein (203) ;mRNA; f:150465-151212
MPHVADAAEDSWAPSERSLASLAGLSAVLPRPDACAALHAAADSLCASGALGPRPGAASDPETDALRELLTCAAGSPRPPSRSALEAAIGRAAGTAGPQGAAQALAEAALARRDDVRAAAAAGAASVSGARLVDFDWRVRMCVAGDRCSQLSRPVTLVNLRLDRVGSAAGKNDVRFEVDAKGLEALISQVEHALSAVEELSS